jgi:UDP-GlcNAc:undecaprenyl-phosphate GlcNAc-1-phosphate transferase
MSTTVIVFELVVSLAIGLTLTPFLIRLAHTHDLLDHPGRHKRHKKPVAVLGGVGLLVAVWLTVGLTVVLFRSQFAGWQGVLPYILMGSLLIFLTGLSDDLHPLSAWAKLAAQVAAGLTLFMGGLRIDPLTVPFYGPVEIGAASIFITVLWVVGLTNAINLIDGLDGLAAGVSLVAAVSLAVIGGFYHQAEVLVFALAMVGFLAGFLYYNRFPARIFLGDSGSMQIGFYFATISLLVPVKTYTAAALYVPLLALGVPLLETGVALTRRLLTGRPPMRADRRHLFHYLAHAGFSPGQIVFMFYSLSVVFGAFSIAMFFWNRLVVFAWLSLFMVVILVLFFILMTSAPRRRDAGDSQPGSSRQTAER